MLCTFLASSSRVACGLLGTLAPDVLPSARSYYAARLATASVDKEGEAGYGRGRPCPRPAPQAPVDRFAPRDRREPLRHTIRDRPKGGPRGKLPFSSEMPEAGVSPTGPVRCPEAQTLHPEKKQSDRAPRKDSGQGARRALRSLSCALSGPGAGHPAVRAYFGAMDENACRAAFPLGTQWKVYNTL